MASQQAGSIYMDLNYKLHFPKGNISDNLTYLWLSNRAATIGLIHLSTAGDWFRHLPWHSSEKEPSNSAVIDNMSILVSQR